MTDHKFTVEEPDRVICFSMTSEEAKEAADWLNSARAAQKKAGDDKELPPAIVLHLYGAFKAIAENRPYGGH
jgi:hypothetical protein